MARNPSPTLREPSFSHLVPFSYSKNSNIFVYLSAKVVRMLFNGIYEY